MIISPRSVRECTSASWLLDRHTAVDSRTGLLLPSGEVREQGTAPTALAVQLEYLSCAGPSPVRARLESHGFTYLLMRHYYRPVFPPVRMSFIAAREMLPRLQIADPLHILKSLKKQAQGVYILCPTAIAKSARHAVAFLPNRAPVWAHLSPTKGNSAKDVGRGSASFIIPLMKFLDGCRLRTYVHPRYPCSSPDVFFSVTTSLAEPSIRP